MVTSGCSDARTDSDEEDHVVQQASQFGEELRRRRLAGGLSLAQLTQRVHYSKGHLSKVERGIKVPSRQLGGLCDAALGAGGNLARLVADRPSGTRVTIGAGDDDGNAEVWLMQNDASSQEWFHAVSRRLVMTAGAASISAITIGRPGVPAGIADASLIGSFRSLFDQYRQLGQAIDARLLLPVLAAQTYSLQQLSRDAGPRTRQQLLVLGSRYAEYAG
jgi:transcriptional regulator with XRE-family HTH domain